MLFRSVCVAEVTETPRLVLKWRGKEIVNISRAFLDTNGAHQETDVVVSVPGKKDSYLTKVEPVKSFKEALLKKLERSYTNNLTTYQRALGKKRSKLTQEEYKAEKKSNAGLKSLK